MQYNFVRRRSTLYMRNGNKVECPRVFVERNDLDVLRADTPIETIKERIKQTLGYPDMPDKHINVEIELGEYIIAYTTGHHATTGTFVGCILHWSPSSA